MTTANVTTLPDLRTGLLARLESFRANVRKHLLLEGLARWLAELIAVALLSFLLDRLLRLGLTTRLVLLSLGLAFLAVEAWRFVLTPLRLQLSLITLAAAIDRTGSERLRGSLAARVASVLELPELLHGPTAPSPSMVRSAVMRCHEALDAVKFEDHLNASRRRAAVSAISALVILPLLLSSIYHQSTGLWFRRYFLGSNDPWPQQTYLFVDGVKDGRLTVPRAEPFVLRVRTRPDSRVQPDTVTLRYRERAGGPRSIVAMTRFAPGDYRCDFPPLGSDADVELTGNDDTLAFTIAPVDRPRITDLLLVSQHPTEPAPTNHNFAGQDADLSFLPKTHLELTFTSNVPVAAVNLKSNVPHPAQPDVKQLDPRKFSLTWTQESPVQLQIELVGSAAGLTSLPTPIAVGLKSDLPPRVSLTFSGVRSRVTPMARIPLAIQARDDYGLAKLDLVTRAEILSGESRAGATTAPTTSATTAPTSQPFAETTSHTLYGPTTQPTDLEIQQKYTLEVPSMKLPAGSILQVSAAATDACYLGPQTGTSRVITFRVVPPEELFREILLRQQGERAKFRKQIEESQKLRDALIAVTSAEQAQALARQHRAVQREVARIATSLAESVTEMKYNQLGGPEAWDLMDKNVLGPLKKLNDDLMTQQRDALDALKPETADSINQATARQDQIIKTMQDILKQMSQWDSFVDVINQLNELIKLETKVKENTEGLKKKQTEGIFD
jgi:hypothetical protein